MAAQAIRNSSALVGNSWLAITIESALVVVTFALIVKAFQYQDAWSVMVAIIGFFVCAAELSCRTATDIASARLIVGCAMIPAVASLFFVSPGDPFVAIYINGAETKTTVTGGEGIIITPFAGHIFYVRKRQDVKHVPILAEDANHTPLTCHASVEGMLLDTRDRAGLEKTLISITRAHGDPAEYIKQRLMAAVEAAGVAALAENTASYLSKEHLIAERIRVTMRELGLRWSSTPSVVPPWQDNCSLVYQD